MRKISHKMWPKNFLGKFGEIRQKSFAPPKICLLLHLWHRLIITDVHFVTALRVGVQDYRHNCSLTR